MLKNKKILLGVTGSIAAYKTAMLVRLLIKDGAEVKVIMTNAAKDFVSPLTLSTLSKNPVISDLYENDTWANHVELGRWADVMVIAPLSCNSLAKLANGLCDNILTAVYLSATCPVVVAPAMDEDMWKHPSTQHNLSLIASYGNGVISVEKGELASGLVGEGRMAEPETIMKWIQDFFLTNSQLSGKNILITAGPTYEAIDPVRFIGNRSSGKMGIAIANECKKRGANVTLVIGPTKEKTPNDINVIHVQSAQEMFDASTGHFLNADIAIMSAAVADYTPVTVADEKIKKSESSISIELQKTPDILKHLGEVKKPHQFLVGFALETNNEEENAINKLKQKNADLIVLNSLQDKGAGFNVDTNKITIFGTNGFVERFDVKPKPTVAWDIVNTIVKRMYE